jgi:tectonin beta-propeller repeat-containing protein 1
MTYHSKKQFTDCVRRRRWYRKCRFNTKGPWQEVGQTKILDLALQFLKDEDLSVAWAISTTGDVLFRRGISQTAPNGCSWEHVPCDMPLISISCSSDRKVLAVSKNGFVLFRVGISSDNLVGDRWKRIDASPNILFKQVSVGNKGIWAIDMQSRLAVRREISNNSPEGTVK